MTDGPARLSDDPELADLLEVATPPEPMTAGEHRRMRRRVVQVASVPLAAGVTAWVKSVAFAAAVGMTGGGIVVAAEHWLTSPSPAPVGRSEAPAAPSATPPRAAPPAPPEASPSVSVLPEPSSATSPGPAKARPPSPAERLDREAALLEAARRALAADPGAALRSLDRHARTFPDGALGIEREMLRIEALQRLGRHGEARALARALLRAHPRGLYGPRLRAIAGEGD